MPFWLKCGPRDTNKKAMWPADENVAHPCFKGCTEWITGSIYFFVEDKEEKMIHLIHLLLGVLKTCTKLRFKRFCFSYYLCVKEFKIVLQFFFQPLHEDEGLLQQDLSSLSGREAHPLDDGHFVEVNLKINFEMKWIFEIFRFFDFLERELYIL